VDQITPRKMAKS